MTTRALRDYNLAAVTRVYREQAEPVKPEPITEETRAKLLAALAPYAGGGEHKKYDRPNR